MSQRTLRRSVLATLLLFTGGVSAQAEEIFTVRIENVSAKDALKLSNGKTEPVGVAPVLYVIHTNRAPLFTSGEPDRGKGLEALAEDGPTAPLEKSLKGQPGIVHVGSTDTPVGASSAGDIWPGPHFAFKGTSHATRDAGRAAAHHAVLRAAHAAVLRPRGEGPPLFPRRGQPGRRRPPPETPPGGGGPRGQRGPRPRPKQGPAAPPPHHGPRR